MDRLRLIETFVAVAKARSLSAAAKQIGCSRASVTKQIQDLESSLGASLLVRTTRKVLPTKLGEKYLDSCSKLLTDLSLADAAIRDAKQAVGGHLTVLLPRGFGDTFFVSAVTQFLVENPSVKLDLVFGDSASHKFGATDGDFDIAIRLWSIPRDSAIVAKKVGELKWTLCASSQFLKTAGPLRTPSDLKRVNCLIHTRFAPNRIWPFSNGLNVKVAGSFSANSVLAIREAALRGLGVAQLPNCYVDDDLRTGALQAVLTDYGVPSRPVYVVFPGNRYIPARTRAFVTFFQRWFRSLPWRDNEPSAAVPILRSRSESEP